MLLIWLGGLASLLGVDKESLPPIRTDRIEVVAAYPGAGPAEVERGVCIPLERAVFDLPGLKALSSQSIEEKCTLLAAAQDGYDLQELMSSIRARTLSVPQLPKAVDRIEVREQNRGSFVINVVLYGPADALTLKRLGEGIRDDLLHISGVSRLGEVAAISDGLAEQWAEARFQGQPAYGIEVYADRDIVTVAERVKAYVAEHARRLPEGLSLATSWDSSLSFAGRVDTLVEDGLSGFVLVFGVLVVFLRTHVAWWAAMGILTSVLGTLWLMAMLGISLNMLSLFGFLLAMGVLVDDAITIGENVHQKQAGNPPREAGSWRKPRSLLQSPVWPPPSRAPGKWLSR